MAQVPLNYGLSAEDGTGDPLRATFAKIQGNLTDLDGRLTSTSAIVGTLGGAAFLNVGSAPGTVADGGQVAANTAAIANEISRAQTAELLKAPIASPSFTGIPTAPTAPAGTGTTQIATTAFVATAVAAGGGGGGGGTGGVPTSRQILTSGLATGGGDLTADRTITVPKAAQSDVATGTDDAKALTSYSIAAALGAKASLASPTFVGTPLAPTASAGSSTTQIATTAFVATSYAPLASPALTGNPTAPTQGTTDNSAKLATTAYADRAATNAAAAVPSAPPTRQTAISGPSSAGAPSFLPATTSGTLTLAAQGVSSTAPLIVTAAQGGLANAIYTYTSNPSWTLTASATNFLFVNASTGATSASTLAPIYQFGGTISTTAGQFTFDWQAMVGYLGNGSTAVATPLVCVGEAVTSASAVTSTVAYAYQGRYQSPAIAWNTSAATGFLHYIGVPSEQIDFTWQISSASTGPWLQNALSLSSVPFTGLYLGGSTSRLGVKWFPGGSGAFADNGTNPANAISSGYILLAAKRRW